MCVIKPEVGHYIFFPVSRVLGVSVIYGTEKMRNLILQNVAVFFSSPEVELWDYDDGIGSGLPVYCSAMAA